MHYGVLGKAGKTKEMTQLLVALTQTFSAAGQATHHHNGQVFNAQGWPALNTVAAFTTRK
jgi:hypothetical protein